MPSHPRTGKWVEQHRREGNPLGLWMNRRGWCWAHLLPENSFCCILRPHGEAKHTRVQNVSKTMGHMPKEAPAGLYYTDSDDLST